MRRPPLTGVLALAAVLAVWVAPASAQNLEGEVFSQHLGYTGPTDVCTDGPGGTSYQLNFSGSAFGPYPGTFTATTSVTIGGDVGVISLGPFPDGFDPGGEGPDEFIAAGPIVSAVTAFTISSAQGQVSGNQSMSGVAADQTHAGVCEDLAGGGQFNAFGPYADVRAFGGAYSATMSGGGSDSGVVNLQGRQGVLCSNSPPNPNGTCPGNQTLSNVNDFAARFDSAQVGGGGGGGGGGTPPPPPPPPPPKGCGGQSGTVLTGTASGERISGGAGRDLIRGLGGDDILLGQGGNDCVLGGADDDILDGHDGSDILRGEGGDDDVRGGNGTDASYGGADDDLIDPKRGSDRAYGDAGEDIVSGGADNDILYGGPGNDLLTDGLGKNEYHAGAGNDIVSARQGTSERIDCGPGNDVAFVNPKDKTDNCERRERTEPANSVKIGQIPDKGGPPGGSSPRGAAASFIPPEAMASANKVRWDWVYLPRPNRYYIFAADVCGGFTAVTCTTYYSPIGTWVLAHDVAPGDVTPGLVSNRLCRLPTAFRVACAKFLRAAVAKKFVEYVGYMANNGWCVAMVRTKAFDRFVTVRGLIGDDFDTYCRDWVWVPGRGWVQISR